MVLHSLTVCACVCCSIQWSRPKCRRCSLSTCARTACVVCHIILLSAVRPMNRQQTHAPRNVSSTPCSGEFYRLFGSFRLIFFSPTTFLCRRLLFWVNFASHNENWFLVAFQKGSQMTRLENICNSH